MGSIFGLTSVFLIFFSLASAQTEKKHRNKTGSLPPLLVTKPTVPALPRLSQGAEGASKQGRFAGSSHNPAPASYKLSAPKECSGRLPLERLFDQPEARSPAVAAPGVFYLSGQKAQYQASADSAPETLQKSQEHSIWLKSTHRSFLPTVQDKSEWLYWSSLKTRPSKLGAHSALAAPSETWVAAYDREKALLLRWDWKNQSSTTIAPLEGDYAIKAISPDESAIALASNQGSNHAQLFIWQKGIRNLGALAPHSDVAFTRDGSGVFFLRPGYQSKNQLMHTSLETLRTRPLTALPEGVNAFGISRDSTKLVFTTSKGTSSAFGGWKLSSSGAALKPLQLPEVEGTVEGAPAVLDEGEAGQVKFFFVYSSNTLPQGLWFWDSENANPWTLSSAVLKAAGCGATPLLAPSEEATFLPPNAENAGWVLFPNAKFTDRFNPAIQYFHHRGFGVLIPATLSKAKALSLLETKYGAPPEKVFEFAGDQNSLFAVRKAAEEFDSKLQKLKTASPFKIEQ